MAKAIAAIYATEEKPDGTTQYINLCCIYIDTVQPYWEVRLLPKIFKVYPNPDNILEDGLWQFIEHCKISKKDFANKPQDIVPAYIEEEYGTEYCNEKRDQIGSSLLSLGFNVSIATWPGIDYEQVASLMNRLQAEGCNIIHIGLSEKYSVELPL